MECDEGIRKNEEMRRLRRKYIGMGRVHGVRRRKGMGGEKRGRTGKEG